MPRKRTEKRPDFARGEPRWWKHANLLPDGSVSSFSYRVAWYENGKRHRQNFATQEEAEKQVAAEKKKLIEGQHDLGTQVTSLSKAQIIAAESAFRSLQTADYFDPKEPASAGSLVRAVEWFVENYSEQAIELPTVRSAVDKFLATRKTASPRTLKSHKGYLDSFCETYGERLIAAITPLDISDFLDAAKVGDVAKLHRWDSLHALFEFCAGKKNVEGTWIGRNPVKQVPEPTYHPNKPQIYTVPEVRRLIEGSVAYGYAPNVVIRLFSMIRAEEMAAMVFNHGSLWPYVNLDTGWLELTKAEVKTRSDKKRGGRRIRISPTLKKWLLEFKKRGWDISENRTQDEKVRSHASPDKIGRGSGFTNLIRHTAISYRVTNEGSFSTVATEAGTSEVIIRASYFQRVSTKASAEFFRLTPDEFTLPASAEASP